MREVFSNRAQVAALLLSTLALFATSPTEAAPAKHLITGSQNTERTNKLTSEIRWHRSVSQAQEDARREGKLVFWVNMLGTLSGAT
ncbi:MAG: hypothetical protein SGJ27_19345 [Candidatus Melainabacteria bacterium]|nr:hypothetical protein [Candidatus Melainabacteria bacterium]